MAVIKVKPRKVVEFFMPLMTRELITPYLATRVSGDLFKGTKGDTVTLKVKGLKAKSRDYDFRGRTGPIVLDDIAGGYAMPIKLNKHVYSATGLEDEHMTLDDVDFAREILAPQAEAVAQNIEDKTIAGFRALSFKRTITVSVTEDPHLIATEARRLMDSDKVAPSEGRIHLVGSDIGAAWLASDRLSLYTSTGQEGTPALRDAVIGRLGGSPVIVHNGLNPNEGYYLHKSALVVANVAPVVPTGVAAGAVRQEGGFGIRWIQDYDANYLRDRSVVSSFCGVNDFRDERRADGSWIFEVGDVDEEDYAASGITAADVQPFGTRKNVRAIKYVISGTGSVLTPAPAGP